MNMFEMYKTLSAWDVVYAALLAFFIMQALKSINAIRKNVKFRVVRTSGGEEAAKKDIIRRCVEMFPLDTVYFRGKVFTKGAMVRVTTLQKRIIEGEIIGRNEKDVICIITGRHIIAHEIDKIEDITEIASLSEEVKM